MRTRHTLLAVLVFLLLIGIAAMAGRCSKPRPIRDLRPEATIAMRESRPVPEPSTITCCAMVLLLIAATFRRSKP
jgi:hypothetical protein